MPKSKRARIVHLSKLQKKGKEHTQKLFADVQAAATQYRYAYVFAVENMRNTYLKDVRAHFTQRDGRLFFGRSKVMAKALGHSAEEEATTAIHGLAPYVAGDVGLLFTNEVPEDVLRYCDEYAEVDFARAGTVATRDFTVPEGQVFSRGGEVPKEMDEPVQHSVEPSLRRWGMPTRLDKGKVVLDGDHELCREGQVLNSHQTALLKIFGVTMAEFRVVVRAWFDQDEGKVEEVESAHAMQE